MHNVLRHRLNGLGPVVYLARNRGMNIKISRLAVFITTISSFGTPASMSFNDDAFSIAPNGIFHVNEK